MSRKQIEEKAARAWRLWLWAFERGDHPLLNAAMGELALCAAAMPSGPEPEALMIGRAA